MTDNEQEPYFQCLDNNTLFSAAYSWIHEDDTTGQQELRTAIGTWPWQEVQSVQTMDDRSFVALEPPRCCVYVAGGQIHLRADYQTVLQAWCTWRRAYRTNYLRFTTEN